MREFRDFCFEFLLPVGLCLALLAIAMTAFIASWDYLDCKGFSNGTGIETRWWWGCYAKHGGEWVPKDYAFGKAHELRLKDKR